MRIRDQDHVARYCSPYHFQQGNVVASGFLPRRGENGISVNWLERYGPDCNSAMDEVRRYVQLGLKPNGRFAVMNVGSVRRLGLQVQYWPKIWDPSHALIHGFLIGDIPVAEKLWNLIVANGIYLAVK